ncbi:MAG TPA: hypothetical protein VMF91_26285 [Bryobacteraceae bacterium]|nr:hypothetical protein [Bryobacteraceae bacterium]
MNLKRRLGTLEQLICDPTTLFFADGTSGQISARGDYVMNLFVLPFVVSARPTWS